MVFRRGTRRRVRQLGNVIQSFKQVSVDGPASRAAATNIIHSILSGVDNFVGPTANNNAVKTGSKVFSVIFMVCFTNLVSVSALLHLHLQCQRAGSAIVTPGVVGGNNNRNQIVHTKMMFLGHDQNSNYVFQVKIPRQYQRIRAGDAWSLVYRCDAVFASATQVIYKYYQ